MNWFIDDYDDDDELTFAVLELLNCHDFIGLLNVRERQRRANQTPAIVVRGCALFSIDHC